MIDVVSFLPGKHKSTSSGWISFNAPCCEHNGESRDKRLRGGMKPSPDGSWSYHCFNCGYTASFILGRTLSFKARKLLQWMNVPSEEIERINLESLKHKSIAGLLSERQQVNNELQGINFAERELPPFAEMITAEHPEHISYLRGRNAPADYPFMCSNDSRPSVIIPFTYNHKIVGHAKRFLDDRIPKYLNDMPSGYVFGTDLQNDSWQYAVVVEGVFDALAINGLAVLHADVNDAQVRLIRSLSKDIIVVPDQDEAGMKLVDRAVELGWAVSMPEWPEGCKDVNDAVNELGKLGTLITILAAKETSKIKIELRKKQLAQRLRH